MSKEIIDLAVVIPTLNEGGHIGHTIDSFIHQSVQPREIMVVDAHSEDDTQAEVMERVNLFPSLKFVQIPKYTIARQRNFGVSLTTSHHLLFLDADMLCGDSGDTKTLERFYNLILTKKPEAAVPYIKPDSTRKTDAALYAVANFIQAGMQWIKPSGTTMCLYMNREIFDYLGGFDPEVAVGEDFELLSRLGQAGGKFKVFWSPVFYTSVRRLDHDGRWNYAWDLLKAAIHAKVRGYGNLPINYDFGHFTRERTKGLD
jgi:glycosyltransferase involved in cell wall biosynthesis